MLRSDRRIRACVGRLFYLSTTSREGSYLHFFRLRGLRFSSTGVLLHAPYQSEEEIIYRILYWPMGAAAFAGCIVLDLFYNVYRTPLGTIARRAARYSDRTSNQELRRFCYTRGALYDLLFNFSH